MRRSLYHAGTSRTVRRDKGGQDETPGRFETPGSPRSHGHAYSANRFGEDDNNGRPPFGNVKDRYECGRDIYTFRRGEEGFNCGKSIKTYIYFTLGWVSFAANSIL